MCVFLVLVSSFFLHLVGISKLASVLSHNNTTPASSLDKLQYHVYFSIFPYLVGIWKLASLSRRYATWRGVEPSTFLTPFRGITSSWNWVIRSNPKREVNWFSDMSCIVLNKWHVKLLYIYSHSGEVYVIYCVPGVEKETMHIWLTSTGLYCDQHMVL